MNLLRLATAMAGILIVSTASATNVGPGDVSGTWTLAGSPYIVQGDITVTDLEALIIEPGVEVLFDGPYVLTVDGQLQAVGTVADSILFSRNAGRTDWGHLEFIGESDTGSQLQYCRIEYGNATQLEAPHSKDGGGIYSTYSSNLSIANCAVEDCRGEDGGGIYVEGDMMVQDCVIRRCSAGGIGHWGGGVHMAYSVDLLNCELSDNFASFGGGGVYGYYLTGSVTGCMIHGNHADAGHGGGLALVYFNGNVSYNGIYGNSVGEGSEGGAAYFMYGEGVFEHNTIVGNTSSEGAGLAYGTSSAHFTHNILAFNNGDATLDIAESSVTFDFTCSFGNTGSDELAGTDTNTVNEHPLFCDYGAADFALCADSPCLSDGIGAEGQGCGNCWPAVESSTWSRLKSLY